MKMSREARGHSCGFISSHAQAWTGKIVSGQEAVEQKQWRGRGKGAIMIMNMESEMNEEEVRIWGKMVSKTEGGKTIRGLNKTEEIWDRKH